MDWNKLENSRRFFSMLWPKMCPNRHMFLFFLARDSTPLLIDLEFFGNFEGNWLLVFFARAGGYNGRQLEYMARMQIPRLSEIARNVWKKLHNLSRTQYVAKDQAAVNHAMRKMLCLFHNTKGEALLY